MKNKPDIILLDMVMPVMNGFEESEKLRGTVETKDIPIVAVTASAMRQQEQVISKYCDDYLSKALQIATLLDVLKKHLEYERREVKHLTKQGFSNLTELEKNS